MELDTETLAGYLPLYGAIWKQSLGWPLLSRIIFISEPQSTFTHPFVGTVYCIIKYMYLDHKAYISLNISIFMHLKCGHVGRYEELTIWAGSE
jgi:hypothetical protein